MSRREFTPLAQPNRGLPTYHPQDTPEYFLTESGVDQVLKRMALAGEADKTLAALIRHHEGAHRSGEDGQSGLESDAAAYEERFGEDPLRTKRYREFYERVNGHNAPKRGILARLLGR